MVVTIRLSTLLTITALHAMALGAGRLRLYVVVVDLSGIAGVVVVAEASLYPSTFQIPLLTV